MHFFSRIFGRSTPQTEEAVDAIVARYRLLTENLAAAVFLRDDTGKIVYCSPYTEVLTGYPTSTILSNDGDFFAGIVHERDREHYQRALRVALSGEPFQFRYRFYHKSGLEMWAETRSVPVDDSSEDRCPTLSITLDVTGTVLYQQQVEDRNKDLRDFTYMITHDLKAPVYTLKGMLGVLEEEHKPAGGSDAEEVLGHMKRAVARLEELIGGVLEYSKISAEQSASEPVALDQVLKDVISDLASQIVESRAALHISSGLPAVLGDRMKIYRIFSNLIGNAIKYRNPVRDLVISIEAPDTRSHRTCAVAVRDNGLGIPSDKIDMIFRPFQRVNPGNIEGTGIGLASVRKLLEKLGGDIEVHSEEGKGSSFVLTLRRA